MRALIFGDFGGFDECCHFVREDGQVWWIRRIRRGVGGKMSGLLDRYGGKE